MTRNFAKVEAKHYQPWRAFVQYCVIYLILYPFFKIFFRVEIHGRENIPNKGIIVAANHTSSFDPVIISLGMNQPIAHMAKQELFHTPVISQLIQILGAFSVNREKLEIATIKSAKSVLSTKWHLGIFPEGTRIRTGKVGTVHKGFGYLAKVTNSEILPMGIIIKRNICPMFGKLIIKIGKPIPVPKTPEEAIENWGKAIAELTGLEFNSTIKDTENNDKNLEVPCANV